MNSSRLRAELNFSYPSLLFGFFNTSSMDFKKLYAGCIPELQLLQFHRGAGANAVQFNGIKC